jgi:hypothetical protein
MEEIQVPAPRHLTDYERIQIATENAFNTLIATAKKTGFALNPPAGLMYVPSQELTEQFIQACREILDSLRADPRPQPIVPAE